MVGSMVLDPKNPKSHVAFALIWGIRAAAHICAWRTSPSPVVAGPTTPRMPPPSVKRPHQPVVVLNSGENHQLTKMEVPLIHGPPTHGIRLNKNSGLLPGGSPQAPRAVHLAGFA